MATPFLSTATALGEQAVIKFKSRKHLITSVFVVLVLAFTGMVTSAYTADHIKNSSCSMSTDAKLSSAYKWATGSAVLSAILTVAMAGVMIKVAMKKKSA